MTILLADQMASQALKVADSAYVLKAGEITSSGGARAMVDDPAFREAYLGKDRASCPRLLWATLCISL